MRVSLSDGGILTDKGDVLVFAVLAKDGKAVLSPPMRAVDGKSGGLISAAVEGGFTAAAGEVLVLHSPKFAYRKIVLAGCGDGDAATVAVAIGNAVSGLGDAKVLALSCDGENVSAAVCAAAAGLYRYRLGAALPTAPKLKSLRVFVDSRRRVAANVVSRAAAVGEGVRLARHLAEQPGNVCTPEFLAQTARKLSREFASVQTKILDEKQLRALKMGAFLAVAKGSVVPPRMIVMQYRGGRGAPVALVGKGVTFDSGGISLKPGAAMDEMKFDMSGAAAVFGCILAAARMRLPLNVAAVIPACENMPDGKAQKPGDVIRAMNGKTIEVLNTDAEGRLILADALLYCARFRPAAVVDAATLTGACVIALGRRFCGMTTHSDKLADELRAAGESAGDGCWRLPLDDSYDRQLKSDYADMANIGGREGGAITAACFLARFAPRDLWAHLDVAGSAWDAKKRATGRPTPLLMHFLMRRAGWK